MGEVHVLFAIIDWHIRSVLAWGISNPHDSEFVTEVLKESIYKHGAPEIFNTDQGSEFTSDLFTGILSKHNMLISLDYRKRALDNILVERLWRSVKYEYVLVLTLLKNTPLQAVKMQNIVYLGRLSVTNVLPVFLLTSTIQKWIFHERRKM